MSWPSTAIELLARDVPALAPHRLACTPKAARFCACLGRLAAQRPSGLPRGQRGARASLCPSPPLHGSLQLNPCTAPARAASWPPRLMRARTARDPPPRARCPATRSVDCLRKLRAVVERVKPTFSSLPRIRTARLCTPSPQPLDRRPAPRLYSQARCRSSHHCYFACITSTQVSPPPSWPYSGNRHVQRPIPNLHHCTAAAAGAQACAGGETSAATSSAPSSRAPPAGRVNMSCAAPPSAPLGA